MQYRPYGKLGFRVSALSFGAMRLPQRDGKVDEAQSIQMIRYAIEHGMNYLDTAYPYHEGMSEVIAGRALRGGYRDRVKVATKLPSWLVTRSADFDRFLGEQLTRLGLESIDFYLLHSLNKRTWEKLLGLGVLEWAERAMERGRFHHLGFSFHDDGGTFKRIVDAYDWSMCQIQYNYMDVENQAGIRGLRYAASKGIAVVVMEPLLGGKLANPPSQVQAIWDRGARRRSAIGWALAWLWSQPEVATVLSGMSSMEQVVENVAIASAPDAGEIASEEQALFDEARAAHQALTAVPCTSCLYCMPCEQGVDIPGNFANYNAGVMFAKPQAAIDEYRWWKDAFETQHIFDHDIRAAQCIQCRECEEKCPQAIPISRWMEVIDRALGANGPYLTSLERAS